MSNRSKIGRRDFIRTAGMSAGGVVLALTASKASALESGELSFRVARRIPVDVPEMSALAVSSDGRIFVAGAGLVAAFDASGTPCGRYPVNGQPGCLAVSPDGTLFLGLRSRIAVLDQKGAQVAEWPDLGERAWLTSLAVDEQNVYAADAGNRHVLRFDHTGKLLNRIGERDPARDIPGLVVPSPYFDVALDAMGALWVVNPGKHGLETYRPDGDLVSSWYRPGMDLAGFCGCCNPIHVAFRSNGSVVTVEKGLNRVKVYAPDTSFAGLVSGPRSYQGLKVDLACKEKPPIKGVAVDAQDRILVLDEREKGVCIYEQV